MVWGPRFQPYRWSRLCACPFRREARWAGLHPDGGLEKPGRGQHCFPRPHASLYPHMDYVAMECKEVCGFASASSAGPPQQPAQVWPPSSPGFAPTGLPPCILSGPCPTGPLEASWLRPAAGPLMVAQASQTPLLMTVGRERPQRLKVFTQAALTLQVPPSSHFAPEARTF